MAGSPWITLRDRFEDGQKQPHPCCAPCSIPPPSATLQHLIQARQRFLQQQPFLQHARLSCRPRASPRLPAHVSRRLRLRPSTSSRMRKGLLFTVPAAWAFAWFRESPPALLALDEPRPLIRRRQESNQQQTAEEGDFFTWFASKVRSDNVIVGASMLVITGALSGMSWAFTEWLLDAARRSITVSVELDSRDESFRWVLEWLADNEDAKRCGAYVAVADLKADTVSGTVQYTPAPGTYWLSTASRSWVFVTRRRRGLSVSPHGGGVRGPEETLRLVMLGRSKARLDAFIAEAASNCRAKDLKRTLIYTGGDHGSWNMAKARLRRPLASVILDGTVAEEVVRDVQQFLEAERWYAEHGIPWKRGYLLHGAPGSGKTSFVTAIAGHLGLNIYALSLGSAGMTDDALQSLMLTVPARTIVLVEDVDAAFSRGLGNGSEATASQLTLSGLLNALDGASSQEGSLMFLTTNFPNVLPERLVRSGRIDVKVKFGLATKGQVERLFRSFYTDVDAETLRAFVAAYPDGALSMADLQGLLLTLKGQPASQGREALVALLQERGVQAASN